MKVNMSKTKVMISGNSHMEVKSTTVDDGHVMSVIDIFVEAQYSVVTVGNGCTLHRKCSGVKGRMIKVNKSFCQLRGCIESVKVTGLDHVLVTVLVWS